MRKAAVVIPTYNESGNIEGAISGLLEVAKKLTNWEIEIVIVDSHSPDGTDKIVKKLQQNNPRLHLVEMNKDGLGKAYLQGFQYALDNIHPFVIFEMDADLSHNPKDIPVFLEKIEKGADFVLGSRYIAGGSIPADWGLHRKIFSTLGNITIRLGFMKLKITDWTNGYRAIKAWIIKEAMPHVSNYSGYVFQVALLDYAVKHDARIQEIPCRFKDRRAGVSKINSVQYILNIFYYIFANSSFVKYVIVGGIGFLVDSSLLYFLFHNAHFTIKSAKLVSSETAILSNFLLNNFWAFSHKKLDHRISVYLTKFVKFNLFSLPSIAIQTIGIVLLSTFFGRQLFYPIGYNIIIILFLVIPYSYFVYNRFIWKSK